MNNKNLCDKKSIKKKSNKLKTSKKKSNKLKTSKKKSKKSTKSKNKKKKINIKKFIDSLNLSEDKNIFN